MSKQYKHEEEEEKKEEEDEEKEEAGRARVWNAHIFTGSIFTQNLSGKPTPAALFLGVLSRRVAEVKLAEDFVSLSLLPDFFPTHKLDKVITEFKFYPRVVQLVRSARERNAANIEHFRFPFPLNFLYYSIILNEDFNFRKPQRCIENMHCHVPWVNSLPL